MGRRMSWLPLTSLPRAWTSQPSSTSSTMTCQRRLRTTVGTGRHGAPMRVQWGGCRGQRGPALVSAAAGDRDSLSHHTQPGLILSFSTVHRIGRTGRSGNTGIATTFINKACGEKQLGVGAACGRGWQLDDRAASALAGGLLLSKQGPVLVCLWRGDGGVGQCPNPCCSCV